MRLIDACKGARRGSDACLSNLARQLLLDLHPVVGNVSAHVLGGDPCDAPAIHPRKTRVSTRTEAYHLQDRLEWTRSTNIAGYRHIKSTSA